MKQQFKELFRFNQPEGNPFKLIGAGFSMISVLLISYFLALPTFASFASMGIFSFLYYHNLTKKDLFIRLTSVGLFLLAGHLLGMLSTQAPWTAPLVVALIAFVGRLYFRLHHIAKPGSFFAVMVTATGTSTKVSWEQIPLFSSYVLAGVVIALFFAWLVSFTEKEVPQPLAKKSFQVRLDHDPAALLDSLFYSFTLFFAAYLSQGLNLQNPYWLVVSAAAILQGDNLKAMMQRNLQRIFGTIVGIGIAAVLLNIAFTPLEKVLVITLIFLAVEFFIPRNYGVANFFTTPMSLMLATLASQQYYLSLLQFRFLGIVLGSLLGLAAAWLLARISLFYQAKNH